MHALAMKMENEISYQKTIIVSYFFPQN